LDWDLALELLPNEHIAVLGCGTLLVALSENVTRECPQRPWEKLHAAMRIPATFFNPEPWTAELFFHHPGRHSGEGRQSRTILVKGSHRVPDFFPWLFFVLAIRPWGATSTSICLVRDGRQFLPCLQKFSGCTRFSSQKRSGTAISPSFAGGRFLGEYFSTSRHGAPAALWNSPHTEKRFADIPRA